MITKETYTIEYVNRVEIFQKFSKHPLRWTLSVHLFYYTRSVTFKGLPAAAAEEPVKYGKM